MRCLSGGLPEDRAANHHGQVWVTKLIGMGPAVVIFFFSLFFPFFLACICLDQPHARDQLPKSRSRILHKSERETKEPGSRNRTGAQMTTMESRVPAFMSGEVRCLMKVNARAFQVFAAPK